MQFNVFALIASALAVVPAFAQPPAPGVLNYDTRYGDRNGLLSTTACSADFGNLHGLKTFGAIPSFPRIAGSFLVENFNDTHCGACYELLYNRADGTQTVLPFTIINSAGPNEFVSSVEGMKQLTGLDINNFPGSASISYREVPSYDCGF
ncbi:Heat-stable 19 kDa antigen [Leucoagaricus sp. SymC.cos]|nr:Heat-stable 19 kDa antigen [Leucoagaricus sp. SymC.cos]